MVRHPNIVQIMAVSFLKNSVLLVSKFIDGRNLEELLFADVPDDKTFTIQACDKMFIGKQICQAVAHLHNLKPLLCTGTLSQQMWWLQEQHILQNCAIWD